MIDITHKNNTLRKATAQAIVRVGDYKTIEIINNNSVPKGNIFEFSKVAGLLAVKKTSEMIPDCHPLPIESTQISFEINDLEIKILVDVKTIYKTGVEVEAMHGASVVALTMYDMLKPIDKNISIEHIKLLKKEGGKSSFKDKNFKEIKSAVIVCSDTISKGEKEDKAGLLIIEELKKHNIENVFYKIIPDEEKDILEQLETATNQNIELIIFTGGTGLSPRDITPDVLNKVIDKKIPGIEETIRQYGQSRTPYSMLSRSVAGLFKNSLVLALPGSSKGAEESIQAIFPSVLHIFNVRKGERHD